jgi:hypothetical protein
MAHSDVLLSYAEFPFLPLFPTYLVKTFANLQLAVCYYGLSLWQLQMQMPLLRRRWYIARRHSLKGRERWPFNVGFWIDLTDS